MNKIVALGTLREDITIEHDFSRPMIESEVKLHSLKRSVGGSVYNTCQYISSVFNDLDVVYCTYNYIELIRRTKFVLSDNKLMIKAPQKQLFDYPTSIIGLKDDGEKQMISFDSEEDTDLLSIFHDEAQTASLIYTSMYEINKKNCNAIVSVMDACLVRKSIVMVDLCPIIGGYDTKIIRSVLSSISVLSGNSSEFKLLLKMLGLQDICSLFSDFPTINMVCIKKGAKGAEIYTRIHATEIKHICRENTVVNNNARNTTGCGDVFNAVVAYYLCRKIETKKILELAVEQSGIVSKGGLPWTHTSTQN